MSRLWWIAPNIMTPGTYLFRPSRYSPPLGHDGLDVYLVTKTDACVNAIRHATFPTANPLPGELTFYDTHQQNGKLEIVRVCAGTFRLRAANNELVRGLSFGGLVQLCAEQDCTLCRLDSTAPVFYLSEFISSTREMLYSAFLALLARRRAALGSDAEYARRLQAADPFQLFAATLRTLELYLGQFRGSWAMSGYRSALAAVRRAQKTLSDAGEWPAYTPELADLV